MTTKFLYMDERFSSTADPRRYVALTGVLIPAGLHREFRRRFYELLKPAIGLGDGVIPDIPKIHAAELFPNQRDDVKLMWFNGIVKMCQDFSLKVFRIGYYDSAQLRATVKNDQGMLGLCFSSLLQCLGSELDQNEIWPVMEASNPHQQDVHFAGLVQRVDYYTALLPNRAISINNENLGELHYVTKRSIYGATADCVSYLLDAHFLVSSGTDVSAFKRSLGGAAEGLVSMAATNEIIEMKFNRPPFDYKPNGPYRYMIPVLLSD